MLKQYKKKHPEITDAIQFTGSNVQEIVDWLEVYSYEVHKGSLIIKVLKDDKFIIPQFYYVIKTENSWQKLNPKEFFKIYEEFT